MRRQRKEWRVAVKLKRIVSVSMLVTLLLAMSGRAEASAKLHFLKSKKFWFAALAVAVPAATSGALASQPSGNVTFPRKPAVAPAQPKRAH
jgi:hypothetical protein